MPPKRSCAFGREAPLCGCVRCRGVHGPNMPLRHTPRDRGERSGGRAVARKIEIAGFAGFSENAARPRNGPAAFSTVRRRGRAPPRAPETIRLVSADLRHHRPGSGHARVGAVPGIGADDD